MSSPDWLSPDDWDDTTGSGSDYEFTPEAPKRKKTALPRQQPPKRPRRKAALKVTPSSISSPDPSPLDPLVQKRSSRGTSRQTSQRPETVGTREYQEMSAEDLYRAVHSGKTAMSTVVDDWLDSYKHCREEGLLVLINFIVQTCGCKGVVHREMLSSMENAEIISILTKEFNEDSVNYPLCSRGNQLKRFKSGLCEFAQCLVHSCQNSIIYDEFLFPSLLSLITGLSDSQVRAFRHTSTLLAMKLMTGLVEVAVSVSVQLQTTQRQYDLENSKRLHDRVPEKLQELGATISELKENTEELSSMMLATFRGVFVHRFRDRVPDIRAACIEELGVWLKMDPEDFLNDGYLKYLGWTLHDKQSPVRLQCVRALQGLYQEKEFIGRLELFTSRFKERMLGMVLDKEPGIAVEVVKLLLLIQQNSEEGLEEEECGHIYPLVYALHRSLACAAGAFLYNRLKSVMASDNQENMTVNQAFLQILISFYIQNEFHEHGAYLVDSLWDVAGSELKDWETMTSLLLDETGLMYEEEGALIDLMICAITQAALAIPPVRRTQGKKSLSMKNKRVQEQDRRRISAHFIPLLPQLLAKYSADAKYVNLLLKVPLHLDLKMYQSGQSLEKHLDLLLSEICAIVQKHTETTVLESCAHLISTLSSESYAFSTRAHLAFSQLLDSLTECFSTYLTDLLQGTADDNDTYSAATALKRIAALSSAKDPTGLKLFNSYIDLLKDRLESRDLDNELMLSALKCAAFHLMWAKVNMVKSVPEEVELKHLKKGVRSFCRICQACLSLNSRKIRDQAFELLCDLLLFYSVNSVSSEPSLQMLVYFPSDSLHSEMAAFVLDYIFTDSEDVELNGETEEEVKIILYQRKRNQLAGYCKLVIYGVLELTAITDVFKHYHKYFKDFGDIIKETINKTKLISPVQSAKIICLTLQQLFSEMMTEDLSRQDLCEIRDLAKKLATSFGTDLHRVRKPLMSLHIDGIRFAFRDSQGGEQPSNVSFLEVLSEFSFKLLQQDCTQLVNFLKSECATAALSWPPVKLYQKSLEGQRTFRTKTKEKGIEHMKLDTPVAKRKCTTVLESSTVRGARLDSSSEVSIHNPVLTSTVQRWLSTPSAPGQSKTKEDFVGSTELESTDEFSSRSQMRRVKPTKQRQTPSIKGSSALEQHELDSHFTLLSLIEDDIAEEEDAEIEGYESDPDASYALPSTRYSSAGVLDELFD